MILFTMNYQKGLKSASFDKILKTLSILQGEIFLPVDGRTFTVSADSAEMSMALDKNHQTVRVFQPKLLLNCQNETLFCEVLRQ